MAPALHKVVRKLRSVSRAGPTGVYPTVWEEEDDPGLADSMRRRAGAAVSGLRRGLFSGSPISPSVPVYFNLLPDAELWPKRGRVGEQRLLLVQYWRQMQREMSKETAAAVAEEPPAAEDVPPLEPAVPQPVSTAPAPIALGPSTGIPAFEDLDDDLDEPAAPAASTMEPVEQSASTERTDILGRRTTWVPASVLFAKKSEEPEAASVEESEAIAGPSPDVAVSGERPSVIDSEPGASPLLLDEPEGPAAVAQVGPVPSMPVVEVQQEPAALADQPAALVAAALVSAGRNENAVADEPAVESTIVELALDEVASQGESVPWAVEDEAPVEPHFVLPDRDVPDVPAVAALSEPEADRVVELEFAEPLGMAAAGLPELPQPTSALDAEMLVPAAAELADVDDMPAIDLPWTAADVLAAQAPVAAADLPAAGRARELDGWTPELFVDMETPGTSAVEPAAPEYRPNDFTSMSVEGLFTEMPGPSAASQMSDLGLPTPSAERTVLPQVGGALFVDDGAVELPELTPEDMLPTAVSEEPSAVSIAVSCEDEPAVAELPVLSIDSETTVTAISGSLTEEAETITPPEPPAEPTLPMAVTYQSSDTHDPREVAGGDLSTHLAPAEPSTDDVVAQEVVDVRPRRAGVIPMPTPKPASGVKAPRHSAIPALQRFLRLAEARRREVAGSVA